jgi:hypothetical protein
MSGLPARTGWAWLKQGAKLFRQQPAALTSLLFTNVLLLLLLSQIPLLGPFLAGALTPSMSIAFMAACLKVEQAQRVPPSVLLTGLRKPVVFELIKVGLVYLAVALVLAGLSRLLLSAEFVAQFKGQIDQAHPPAITLSDALVLLGVMLLDLAALLITCYTAALIYWQKMGVAKAIFFSAVGVLRSARAFLLLLMAAIGILFVGMLVIALILGKGTFGTVVIMWVTFLYMLIVNCAVYCGYRQIFGVPEAAPAPGVTGG